MTLRTTQTPIRPPAAFRDIIERAVTAGVDAVLLEWVPEGLEVTWMVENTGLGTVISSKEGNRITRFIVRAAGLERRRLITYQASGSARGYLTELKFVELFGGQTCLFNDDGSQRAKRDILVTVNVD